MSTPGQASAESLLSAEKRTLEMIVNGASLPDVLNDLCLIIDAHAPGVISTVLLMDPDGKRLWPGAGPRFPAQLIPAISPWPIGANRGACGTAAFLKQRVIISDVKTDPRWPDDYRALAVGHGLRAAWSEPLISKDGAVLGTFAMYYAEPRTPDTSDLELIETAGDIALIAIQMERSQATLRENEERFRLVANTAPVMIWMSDTDGLCTYVNQPCLEFSGKPLEAALGRGWAENLHPEDVGRSWDTYRQALERREPFQIEHRLRRHDGQYRRILASGVPRFKADGSFAGYIGSAIDISELKQAEEALRKSDERLRLAMDSGKLTGWDRDVKSGRDSLFGDLQGMFGIPSEIYDGRVEDFHRYLHPEDRRRVVEAIDYAMETHKPYAAEFRLRWPDGTVRWLTAKGKFHYSRDGEPERMLGVAIDITDRKLMEVALRESEERLRLAAQAGRMYAFDWDVLTDVIVRSEESTHIFGLTAEPIRLTKHELLARVHPEDRTTFINSIVDCTPESPNTQISYRLLRPDGSVLWLERTGHAFFDEQGRMVRMIGMVADITERKVAEKELAVGNERFRLAMESGKSVVWEWDVQTGRDSWFGDLRTMFGILSDSYVGNVEDFRRRVHPVDRGRVWKAVNDAMQGHEPYAAEFRVVWPDGTVRWASAKGKFYYSKEGKPERMLGMATDITDSKKTELALRESEERFRLAAQAGKMYAFEWDAATDVILRSGEPAQIMGNDELAHSTGQQVWTQIHADDRERLKAAVGNLSPERPCLQINHRMVRPDGAVIWVERNCRAHFDEQGRMVRMIGMVADITERKLADDKLQEYERTVEGLEEMIIVVDREYRFLIANNKFLKMRNMTKEQVVGRFVHEVLNKGVFEAVVKEKLDECFQDNVVRYEMKYTYPELGERDILVSYFPIEGVTGVDRVACVAQDITERKLAEEALSTVSQKLIEAQEEERTRMARELHDDIGQRLVLLAWQLGSSKGDLRKQIEDLANDVQALSHQLHSPKLDYLGLAAAAAGFCKELSDRQRVEIEFHSENIPKELSKEISLCLFRVLQEALQNAIKHSGSRQFQVSLNREANEIELTVHDSGVGFEPEEAIKGRGLGLTSMRERLKLVNGELSIHSQLERGTTIKASVPFSSMAKSVGAAGIS